MKHALRLGLALALILVSTLAPAQPNQWGRKIYEGQSLVPARMSGHDQLLPSYAARCVNCHRETRPSNPVIGVTPLAPQLDSALLTESRSRRRGPKSRYEGATFCELLRTGVDPVGIMIDQTMPRYEISDAQCNALWRYLTFDKPRPIIISSR